MKITIIEQNRDLLASLERFLEKIDNEVEVYFDPLNLLSKDKIDCDLLLVDQSIPRVKYMDAISIIKKKCPGCYVAVLLDEYSLDLEISKDNIVNEYISRPFLQNQLIELLNRVKERDKR